ncbi:unnamed protein product [Soboliphyme baturini]|uniref:Uncharacterized protein n=1 Tax=Soboliphyme baturini TaxID=241478 RepID=A0A183IN48_9BILA|nr:unnamed protein product [Soboliphyme baturini]
MGHGDRRQIARQSVFFGDVFFVRNSFPAKWKVLSNMDDGNESQAFVCQADLERQHRKEVPPATHDIDALANYTGSAVAPVTNGRAGCWGSEADGEKSTIRACSPHCGSKKYSSITMAADGRRNDGEHTNKQRSRYPF